MADKEISIRFNTTADTSGAQQTKKAIEDVAAAAAAAAGQTGGVVAPGLVAPTAPAPAPAAPAVPAATTAAVTANFEALSKMVTDAERATAALSTATDSAQRVIGALDAVVANAAKAATALGSVADRAGAALSVPPGTTAPAVSAVGDAADKTGESLTDATGAAKRFGDTAPDVARPGKSIRDLKDEVARLEAELERLPIGSKAFADMAAQIGNARKALTQAQAEAAKLGSTVGRSGNAGMAVLEFSRAFEDAQYGVRGLLNNIPSLISYLGGGAGLAGVISIAAVGANLLWERLSDGSAKAAKSTQASGIRELLKALNEDLKAIKGTQAEMAGGSLTRSFEDRVQGFKEEKTAVDNYIDSLKSAIKYQGDLAAALQKAELARIDTQEREDLARLGTSYGATKGTQQQRDAITAEQEAIVAEAARQRDQVKLRYIQEDLDRSAALDDAELARAQAKQRQVQQEADAAEEARKAAEAALKERQAELESLKRQATIREDLDNRYEKALKRQAEADRSILAGAITGRAAISDLSQEEIEKYISMSRNDGGKFNEKEVMAGKQFVEALTRVAEAAEAANQIAIDIGNRVPLGVKDTVTKDSNGNDVVIKSASARAEEELRKGDPVKGIKSLSDLSSELDKFTDSARNAKRELEIATSATSNLAGRNQQAADQREGVANANNSLRQEVEARSGEAVKKLLDDILSKIPNAANNIDVRPLVDRVNQIVSDGLQKSEVDEATNTLIQVMEKLKIGDSARLSLYQRILANQDQTNTALGQVAIQLDRQKQTLDQHTRQIGGLQQNAKYPR